MKYEYKIKSIYHEMHTFEIEKEINKLANEGWRLKMIIPLKHSIYKQEFFFERKLI